MRMDAGRHNLCWGYSTVLYPVGPTSQEFSSLERGKSNIWVLRIPIIIGVTIYVFVL